MGETRSAAIRSRRDVHHGEVSGFDRFPFRLFPSFFFILHFKFLVDRVTLLINSHPAVAVNSISTVFTIAGTKLLELAEKRDQE
jgi:hypothetical protein